MKIFVPIFFVKLLKIGKVKKSVHIYPTMYYICFGIRCAVLYKIQIREGIEQENARIRSLLGNSERALESVSAALFAYLQTVRVWDKTNVEKKFERF